MGTAHTDIMEILSLYLERKGRAEICYVFWAEGFMNAEGERHGKSWKSFVAVNKKECFIAGCCMRGRERK
jgi:hypothetical protein